MPQVQGFVGIGGAVFDHHHPLIARSCFQSVAVIAEGFLQQGEPYPVVKGDVQEAADHVKCFHLRRVRPEMLPDQGSRIRGGAAHQLNQRKHHQRQVPLKFLAGLLQLKHTLSWRETKKLFHRILQALLQDRFNIHALSVL